MTYVSRSLQFTIQLGEGSFGDSGFNTITLVGHRAIVEIQNVLNNVIRTGGGIATARIYGMTLDKMNSLSVAGLFWQNRNNRIMIQAGDAQSGLTTVFLGIIIDAYPDFSEEAMSAFVISALNNQDIALKPVAPASFNGPTDAADIMKSIASGAGLGFENNGVSVQLRYPYFAGTAMRQMAACAKSANCFAYIDAASNILAIWPKSGSRGGNIPVLSPATGNILYPMHEQNRIIVRALYDPSVKFGGQVKVESQLTAANGTFNVIDLRYSLSSQMPDGPWEMIVTCIPPDLPKATVTVENLQIQ